MSEETPKTTEETPKITIEKKEKDPKRIEAGKRLAAISKAAKERKMLDKIESENSNGDFNINYGLVFNFIGTAVAIASLYYKREEYKRDTLQPVVINRVEQEKEPNHVETIKPTKKTARNYIRQFGIIDIFIAPCHP